MKMSYGKDNKDTKIRLGQVTQKKVRRKSPKDLTKIACDVFMQCCYVFVVSNQITFAMLNTGLAD